MSFFCINGVTFHHRLAGPPAAPALVFVNSLGTDARIWDAVVASLAGRYRILCYDKRGHGLSDAPAGPYRLDDHIGDLLALADRYALQKFAVCGVSVGGLIAQGLAARHAARVSATILCDTAAKVGSDALWNERIAKVKAAGVGAIADATVARWFSPQFVRERGADVAGYRNMLVRTDPEGYASTCAILRDTDLTDEVRGISVPTLMVAGEHDQATPPDVVRATAGLIPGARFETIRGAGHLPSVEQPATLAALIGRFLEDVGHA